MPFMYKIDEELGLILYVGHGTVTAQEMFQAERAAAQDPLRQPSMKIIMDLSDMEIDISLSDLRNALTLNRERLQNGGILEPTAVISRNTFSKTFGEAFQLIGADLPLTLDTFDVLQDAVHWLGLDEQFDQVAALRDALAKDLQAVSG